MNTLKEDIDELPTVLQDIIYDYKEQLDRTSVLMDVVLKASLFKVQIVTKIVNKMDDLRIQIENEEDNAVIGTLIDLIDIGITNLTEYVKDRDDTFESSKETIYRIASQM